MFQTKFLYIINVLPLDKKIHNDIKNKKKDIEKLLKEQIKVLQLIFIASRL